MQQLLAAILIAQYPYQPYQPEYRHVYQLNWSACRYEDVAVDPSGFIVERNWMPNGWSPPGHGSELPCRPRSGWSSRPPRVRVPHYSSVTVFLDPSSCRYYYYLQGQAYFLPQGWAPPKHQADCINDQGGGGITVHLRF